MKKSQIKNVVLFLGLGAALMACTKNMLTDDERIIDNRNLKLKLYTYWGSNYFSPDSTYWINSTKVKVEDVRLVLSHYYFTSNGDTVTSSDQVTVVKAGESAVPLAYLAPGTYDGWHHFICGLDSTQDATAPDAWPSTNAALTDNADLYRGKNQGYNYVYISGKYHDPADTVSTGLNKSFTYRVATEDLITQYDKRMTFNVVSQYDINILVNFNIQLLLAGFDPTLLDEIESNPSMPDDFSNASALRDNLENYGFVILQ